MKDPIFFLLNIKYQTENTSTVQGIVNAQYTQKRGCTTVGPSHCRVGMAKRAAKNVAGRKTIVIIAMVFMAELSSLVDLAISILVLASWPPRRLKIWAC